MTINQLLKKCDMGFDLIIIQDKDSGEAPAYYHIVSNVLKDYGKWKVDSWKIGFNVEDNKPYACLYITV